MRINTTENAELILAWDNQMNYLFIQVGDTVYGVDADLLEDEVEEYKTAFASGEVETAFAEDYIYPVEELGKYKFQTLLYSR